jgi:hypothetical protein
MEKRESRVFITGLSEDNAVEVMQLLKEHRVLPKGSHLELDHPGPDDLLEKEFDQLSMAMRKLFVAVDEMPDCGGCETKREVLEDLGHIKRSAKKFGAALAGFELAVTKLEVAAKKLK